MERNFQHITDQLRNAATSVNQARVSANPKEQIVAALKYGQTLKNQNIEKQKSNKQMFIILGVVFTAGAFLLFLTLLGVHLPWGVRLFSIKAAWGLLAAFFFTLRAVRFDPQSELTQRIARMRFGREGIK